MEAAASKIAGFLPGTKIIAGDSLCWSPKTNTITYRADDKSIENMLGLLHEAGHAHLKHLSYDSDMELLMMEVDAWEAAVRLAEKISQKIDTDHIQDCLDTYRDWLHQRSTCPRCGIVSFQETKSVYRCHNCAKHWTVSASRLCRPYRLSSEQTKNRPEPKHQAVFQIKSRS